MTARRVFSDNYGNGWSWAGQRPSAGGLKPIPRRQPVLRKANVQRAGERSPMSEATRTRKRRLRAVGSNAGWASLSQYASTFHEPGLAAGVLKETMTFARSFRLTELLGCLLLVALLITVLPAAARMAQSNQAGSSALGDSASRAGT